MAHELTNGVELLYEEIGQGQSLLFVHERGGDPSEGPCVRTVHGGVWAPQTERLSAPTLVMVSDEGEPAIQPGFFMRRKIPGAGLVMSPYSGHTINLGDPDLFNRAPLDFLTGVEGDRWPSRVHPR